MKFSEKKTQVLNALYEKKYDNNYYDIAELLGQISISISTSEALSIGRALEQDGYIRLSPGLNKIRAMIIGDGVEFIEEYDMFSPSSTSFDDRFTDSESVEINKKLDELLARFDKLELGQQITYDDFSQEIDELRELFKVVNKKTWIEILKGKLITFGLGTITEKGIELIQSTFGTTGLLK